MEIVLGIDNIIFISILVSKVPQERRAQVRRLGLFLALFTRLALLFSLTWLMTLNQPIVEGFGHGFSAKDLILILGGLFLVAKATFEIHEKIEEKEEVQVAHRFASPAKLLVFQIALFDIIFSLDSVITAVGMAQHLEVMVLAVVLAVAVMLFAAGVIGDFVDRHPTIKILALSFLILIGVTLLIEGLGGEVSKGYIYFAIFFSLSVEGLNLRYFRKQRASTSGESRS
jgi:predicted tellurium resistance membrane protein TerC